MKRAAPAHALTYPKTFRARRIAANGTKLYVRVGGLGPAVVLLHGYGETGDMWVPPAKDLARDHTVVVPDLRGMGLSAKPAGGYDKKMQGGDVAGILDALKIERAALVTHDIGNMVGYAFAAQFRDRATCFVVIDAPLPGVGPWEEILKNPLLWHFRFGGPDMERLVAGRERIYLDRFWNVSPPRQSGSVRRPVATMRSSMRARARCTRALRSSRPSTKTPSTTGPSSRRASSMCRFLRWAAKNRSARRWPR
jgi:pimeloyl-ACP methyl ester carboxylesterase